VGNLANLRSKTVRQRWMTNVWNFFKECKVNLVVDVSLAVERSWNNTLKP
jgi:hypothetical protein